MLSFTPTFTFSSFTLKRLFSSSLLSAIRVVSYACLRLLIFLSPSLISGCASSILAFHMLGGLWSKAFKPGFSSAGAENLQMFKLDLEKAEDQTCQHLLDHKRKQGNSRKTSASLTMRKTLTPWIITNWKILKEMGIPDHLTCLLRELYANQEATVRTLYGTTDWFKIRKGLRQDCILSPYLFNLYAEYVFEMLGWMNHRLQPRLPGEISITSDMQMTPPLWQKVKRN